MYIETMAVSKQKNIRDVALVAETENSPSESGAMAEAVERTWRHAVTQSVKRQDSKSCVCPLGKTRISLPFKINVRDYTETPGPRLQKQGDYSGEDFYCKILRPTMEKCVAEDKRVVLDLSGVDGYPAGFVDEAFGRLTMQFGEDVLKEHLVIEHGPLFSKCANMIWEDIAEWESVRKTKIGCECRKVL